VGEGGVADVIGEAAEAVALGGLFEEGFFGGGEADVELDGAGFVGGGRAAMIWIMELKLEPNRSKYVQVLRGMSPAQRLKKAIELSELGKRLFLHGLVRRFPDATKEELHALYLQRMARCHNRNY
jgi:hypothetical protein